MNSQTPLDHGSLFSGTAYYYRKYRRPYPSAWIEQIVRYFNLDGKGALLDLGCGTGELTVPLSRHVARALGLDPSADMLEQAAIRAQETGVKNCTWIHDKAENMSAALGPLRLVTSGVSFHWMQTQLVLQKSYDLLEEGGGLAIVIDASPVRGKSKTEPWKAKRKEIIEKYLGPARRAGTALYADFVPERMPVEVCIEASPFRTFEKFVYEYETRRTIDEILGFLYSTSYSAKKHFGDEASNFEQEIRDELLKLVPSGVFVEPGHAELFMAKK